METLRKYRAVIRRTVEEQTTVEVEAPTRNAAEDAAIDKADHGDGSCQWELSENNDYGDSWIHTIKELTGPSSERTVMAEALTREERLEMALREIVGIALNPGRPGAMARMFGVANAALEEDQPRSIIADMSKVLEDEDNGKPRDADVLVEAIREWRDILRDQHR